MCITFPTCYQGQIILTDDYSISSHLGRQDAIRWTPQMEEALQVITMNQSCPGDQPFVFQVRLQLLKQRADDIRQQDETDCARTGTTPTASVPRLLYIKTLRRQLDELRSSFPPELLQRGKSFLRLINWRIVSTANLLTICRHIKHTRTICRTLH